MKFRLISIIVFCSCFLTILTVYPSASTQGIKDGLLLCGNIIIPSLFPFTVCVLLLFETNATNLIAKVLNKPANLLFNSSGSVLMVYILSCVAGYPVGSSMIEKMYNEGLISKNQGQLLLGYCVNPGPAFIVIAVGVGMLKNQTLGLILLVSNLIASFITAFVTNRFNKQKGDISNENKETKPLSEAFVNATYQGCTSLINICSFVMIFSAVSGLLNNILPVNIFKKILLSSLEITNGIIFTENNIYIISFLLGFGGLCVHFQVLSVCKNLKPSYLIFFLQRILHGALSALVTFSVIKIFSVPIETISTNTDITFVFSRYNMAFFIAILVLSVCFMASMQKKITI